MVANVFGMQWLACIRLQAGAWCSAAAFTVVSCLVFVACVACVCARVPSSETWLGFPALAMYGIRMPQCTVSGPPYYSGGCGRPVFAGWPFSC